jgi:hypothetical protein
VSESQAPAGDNLVSASHSSPFAAALKMTTGSGAGEASGKEETNQGVLHGGGAEQTQGH